MAKEKPPTVQTMPEQHDPYKIRTLEQILSLFDGGEFLKKLLEDHRALQVDLLDHAAEHGSKGCQGSMTIQISYALGKSGDVNMGAAATFKPPKKPASSATAYINERGELTLYSPFMARMHTPKDVTDYDPETGEIRDVD